MPLTPRMHVGHFRLQTSLVSIHATSLTATRAALGRGRSGCMMFKTPPPPLINIKILAQISARGNEAVRVLAFAGGERQLPLSCGIVPLDYRQCCFALGAARRLGRVDLDDEAVRGSGRHQ